MKGPIWEGVFKSFKEVPVTGTGFSGKTWIGNALKKIALFKEQADSKKTVPVVTANRDSLLPMLAGLVYGKRGCSRILDYGGGVGFSYYQVINGLPMKENLELHVVEVEEVCSAGREFFVHEPGIRFHSTLPEEIKTFDIVNMGSSLHYIEGWQDMLHSLCKYQPEYFLMMDLIAGDIPTFATAQNYYDSKIPVWFFNVNEVIEVMKVNGFKLIFKSAYIATILGKEGSLRLDNFDEKYRIDTTCNLLFIMER